FDPRTGKNIKWTAQLGTETHSTPIVAGGRVYVGTNNGAPRDPKHQGDRGVLMCFEEKTGNLLWQFVVPKREEDPYFDWPKTGMSSPVTVQDDRKFSNSISTRPRPRKIFINTSATAAKVRVIFTECRYFTGTASISPAAATCSGARTKPGSSVLTRRRQVTSPPTLWSGLIRC